MAKPDRSLLLRLSKQASQDFKLPLFLAVAFEIISFFQVFAIIIKSTFPNESDSIELITFLKKIFLFPSIFGLWDATTSQVTSEFLWVIFGIYVIGLTVLLIIVTIMVYSEVLNSKLYKLMTIFCLIHTRILYLPIHYFFLQSIHYYRYQTASDTSPWFALGGILGATVIWEVLSFVIGFLKEFYFFRINKTRNSYCSKNNTTSKVLFLYKAFVPLILLLTQASKGSAIAIAVVSILTSILLIHTIYTKLPFYDITLLRCSYILASMMASFSILGLFNSLVSSTRIMETILIVMTTLLARATNLTMEQLFERIIGGDIPTAEMAIHYPILLKRYTSNYTGLILVRNSFPLESIYFYSTFEPKQEDPTKPKDKKMTKLKNQEFYSKIMEKFLASRAYQKNSEVLLLYMSRIFMKKLEDASRALSLIDKVKTFDVSIPIRNSIESLQITLQESYIKAFSYSEDELELSNYFAYREEFNSLKANMQAEITKHLQFWQELMLDDVNVKKTVDLADGIDSIYLKIRDRWRKNSDKFSSVYPSSLLMYGLYLDTIRGLPQESMQVIQKFYNYNKNQNYNKSLISETSAIIIASLEKDKLGIVIDASNTVESLFKISKENLIGEKVNILMPSFIAKNHDWWMQRYLQSSMVTGVDRRIHSYAKAGDAILGIEVNLKLFPYLDKGVNIMAYLKMTTQEDHSFIVKPDGTVAECPPRLTETLGNFGLNLKNVSLLDVCPKFPKVNTAFNLVYGSAETKLKTQEDQETAMNNKNELDDALRTKEDFPLETHMHTYNYTHMDTQGDQGNVPLRTKNEEAPLIVLNDFPRSEAMKRSNTLSSPLLRHPSQYVDLKTLPMNKQHTYVSENEAKDICDVFKGNSVLRFQNFAPKFAAKREDITIEVTIEPYVIEGEVYKIVKVFDVQIASQQDLDVSMDPIIQMSPFVSKGSQLEQYVSYKSKTMSHQTPSEFSIPDEKDEEIPKAKEQHVVNSKTLKQRLSQMKESDTKDERQKKIDSLGLNHHKEEMDNLDIRQSLGKGASSTKSYSHMDYKLIKTLHDFFGERKVRLMTRVSIYGVYLIMAGILALAFINFIFTQKSLTEIDNGVNIVNVSSQRLTASLTAWQWMLLLYSRLIGLRPVSSLAGLLQSNMVSSSQQMEALNNELRADLNTIGSTEIINEIFSTKTRFYDPVTKLTLTNGTLDIFTAVNVLALNYMAVGVSTANDSVLVQMSEPLTAINNTANDFLVSSETQNEQIIAGLQTIINQNISLLETILGCENFALVLLAISLIAVMRVVIKSYARTFMALVRITPESINERVYRIKKFQTSLDENIEAKSFIENLNLYLNFFEEARDKKFLKNKEKKLKFFSKRYSIRSLVLYMLQYLLISILFVLIISGLFVTLFVESLRSFSLLSGINDQLSVTNKLSYESSLVLSTFYFYVMFQNDTTMLIRNEAPAIQLQENLATLSNANNELLNTLFAGGSTDPVIEQFLQDNICGYLSASIQSTCLNSTQNNSLGLLSFNLKYYTISKQYVDVYQADTSLTNTKAVVQGYFNDVTLDISVLNDAYSFLTQYIMGNFDSEVSSLQDLNLFLSLGAVLFIVVATILIQTITIRKYITLDNSQKKIYRTLTYNVFSQNKSVGFLLKKEFGGQIEGLNRILYV